MSKTLSEFNKLLEIMDRLRNECPWDKKQTNKSLRTLTIEEVYELADAITEENDKEICNELGDILLHIVFYAKIAEEKNSFEIFDVINKINEKLIYRHPHVFKNYKKIDEQEVKDNWEKLKLKEGKTVLGGIPKSLPAMIKALRIQDKVRGVGFDWDEKEQVWDKVQEEIEELKVELKNKNRDKIEKEFGDLFFSLINAARLYDINPENALERTNKKFINRFNYLEDNTIAKGEDLRKMSLENMNLIWEKAKKNDID